MIEQWYAVHKKTGEFFCHKGRYCFSKSGLKTSIRNGYGVWEYVNPHKDYDYSQKCLDTPEDNWDFRKVELT
jgi:hypothetical protein